MTSVVDTATCHSIFSKLLLFLCDVTKEHGGRKRGRLVAVGRVGSAPEGRALKELRCSQHFVKYGGVPHDIVQEEFETGKGGPLKNEGALLSSLLSFLFVNFDPKHSEKFAATSCRFVFACAFGDSGSI